MISRILFWLVFAVGFCIAQQIKEPTHPRLSTVYFLNNQPGGWPSFFIEINQTDSVSHRRIDSVGHLNVSNVSQSGSIKTDLLRAAVGSAIGGVVGIGIGGYLPVFLRGEFNSRDFPTNAFYLRSYVSASVLAALSSAAALQLSKQREISYWKFASYSLVPSMLLVVPISVYASVNPEREELVRSVWAASIVSIGVSVLWTVLIYRTHPRGENRVALNIGGPLLSGRVGSQNRFGSGFTPGVKIVEVRF
jgi:hypothetical protein